MAIIIETIILFVAILAHILQDFFLKLFLMNVELSEKVAQSKCFFYHFHMRQIK